MMNANILYVNVSNKIRRQSRNNHQQLEESHMCKDLDVDFLLPQSFDKCLTIQLAHSGAALRCEIMIKMYFLLADKGTKGE